MTFYLNINTSATVVHTNRLKKLHRSALPNAIRNTLNKCAFYIKQDTMPKSADRSFIKRQPNFFKANSRVEMAKGFDVNTMRSTVGFISEGLRGSNNFAVKELEQQEYGGTIPKRSFIPLDAARIGGSPTRVPTLKARLSEIEGIVNSNLLTGASRPAKFIRAAFKAGVGGHVIGNFPNKKLYRIEKISRSTGKLNLKTKALYYFKKGRSVKIDSTGFMRRASMQSQARMDQFYISEANRIIQKVR